MNKQSKREALRAIGILSGVGVSGVYGGWVSPVVDTMILPAHAQTTVAPGMAEGGNPGIPGDPGTPGTTVGPDGVDGTPGTTVAPEGVDGDDDGGATTEAPTNTTTEASDGGGGGNPPPVLTVKYEGKAGPDDEWHEWELTLKPAPTSKIKLDVIAYDPDDQQVKKDRYGVRWEHSHFDSDIPTIRVGTATVGKTAKVLFSLSSDLYSSLSCRITLPLPDTTPLPCD